MASESPEPASEAARRSPGDRPQLAAVPNQVGTVLLYGVPIVSLVIDGQERLCLAQISNTLLKEFSYNEIHNRRVALGITCVQCTPVQLEILRRAGAMPVSSRRCGMITRREAERLCKSFLGDNSPPRLPDDFAFAVHHDCAWGCRGAFLPARYNSSRAKCIRCAHCGLFFSPNKFIFHSHRASPAARYVQPDAANFNSWRRHMRLSGSPPEQVVHAWEDVKAMFNGGTRKRLLASSSSSSSPAKSARPAPGSPPPPQQPPPPRVPPFPDLLVDYVWQHGVKAHHLPFPPWPWLGKRVAAPLLPPPPPPGADLGRLYPSAFRPVLPAASVPAPPPDSDEETVDVESTEDDPPPARPASPGAPQDRLTEELPPEADSEPKEDGGAGAGQQTAHRLWTVAQLSLQRPDRLLYRHEVARQLHLVRELGVQAADPRPYYEPDLDRRHCRLKEAHSALQQLSGKMALDCSACHQLYLPPGEPKLSR